MTSETKVIKDVLETGLPDSVSSTVITGHLNGSGRRIEAISVLLSIETGIIHPT